MDDIKRGLPEIGANTKCAYLSLRTKARDCFIKLDLHFFGKRGRKSLEIHFFGFLATRLDKKLVSLFVGKKDVSSVDTVSGATISSTAFKEAVEDACLVVADLRTAEVTK